MPDDIDRQISSIVCILKDIHRKMQRRLGERSSLASFCIHDINCGDGWKARIDMSAMPEFGITLIMNKKEQDNAGRA